MGVRFRAKAEEVEKAMSLLSESMEGFRYKDRTTQEDGYGGVDTVWVDGAQFQAAAVLDSSMEARRAAGFQISKRSTSPSTTASLSRPA